MSVRSNPYIETNSLVFCYDMSNTQKSWKGKPTTNYVITKVENYTGWTGAGWWMHPGNTTSVTTQDLPDGNIGPVLNATTLSTGGLYGYNGYALGAAYVSGTQYTVSFWARAFDGTASINVRDADSGGTLSSAVSGITNVWKRFSFTWTANASTNMLTFTGTNFSLYNVQLEINSFATPFVVGTRSNTQALLDLTNINTITATSLTYNSNGTFSFVNSADVIDIPSTSLFNLTSVNFSIELWVYIDPSVDTSGVYHGLVEIGSAGSTFLLGIWRSGLFPGCLYNTFGGATMFGTDGSGGYLGANYKLSGSWNHVVFTRNGATSFFYLNGNTWATRSTPSIPNASNNLKIGSSPSAGTFPGIIPVFRFYNGRALTAAEVRQNFYAHKGRYRP